MAKDSISSEITELKKKLEENSDSLVFAPLADAYRKMGNLDEAFNVCKKGLEKHPNYTSARVVLGRIFQEQEKVEQAANEFKKVLESDSDNILAHSLLGAIFVQKGDHQAAIEEYQKVLSLNPDDEETQEALKQTIEKAASQTKASKPVKAELAPSEKSAPKKESTATLTIAELYLKQGHFDKAIEVFQELLANDPQNLMLRQKLADVVEKQQKDSSVETGAAKLKKNEFTQPPDQKEDVLEEGASDPKQQVKPKKEDDSKFTSDDILQVMRRGGKDDVVVEEKKAPVATAKPPVEPKKPTAEVKAEAKLSPEKTESLKGVLAELNAMEGIMRCFVTDPEGNTVVSFGESSNNADLGQKASVIFASTHRSVSQLNQGRLSQVLVTAESGHILLVSFAKFILVVLANSKINLGLLRLSLDSALKKLEKIL